MTARAETPGWTHFAHAGDVGVCGSGQDMAEAFENAARAMCAVVAPPGLVRPEREVTVACEAPDPAILLVDWLNAVIYEMATRGMLFSAFEVSIDGARLTARLRGEPVVPARHEPAVELKGATLTELSVGRGADGLWRARCVVDV